MTDREKIMDAARKLDAAVKALERERGY